MTSPWKPLAAALLTLVLGCGRKAERQPPPAPAAPPSTRPVTIEKAGTTTTITMPEKKPSFDETLAAYEAAPDEPNAVDGEKVVKLGLKRDPALMYYVDQGDVWAYPSDQPPQKLTSTGLKQNIKFMYYLDQDGDIARRRK